MGKQSNERRGFKKGPVRPGKSWQRCQRCLQTFCRKSYYFEDILRQISRSFQSERQPDSMCRIQPIIVSIRIDITCWVRVWQKCQSQCMKMKLYCFAPRQVSLNVLQYFVVIVEVTLRYLFLCNGKRLKSLEKFYLSMYFFKTSITRYFISE